MDQLKDAYSIRHAQLLRLEELLILLETPPWMRGMNALFDRKMLMAFVGIPFSIFILTSILEGFYWGRLFVLCSMLGLYLFSSILSGYLFVRKNDAARSLELVALIMRIYAPVNKENEKLFKESVQLYLANKNTNKMNRKDADEISSRIRTWFNIEMDSLFFLQDNHIPPDEYNH